MVNMFSSAPRAGDAHRVEHCLNGLDLFIHSDSVKSLVKQCFTTILKREKFKLVRGERYKKFSRSTQTTDSGTDDGSFVCLIKPFNKAQESHDLFAVLRPSWCENSHLNPVK